MIAREAYYRDLEASRAKGRAQQAKYLEQDPERIRANKKRSRDRHAQANRDRAARYYRENREQVLERVAPVHRARERTKRGIVDLAYCEVLEQDVCSYCGGPAGQVDHIDADLAQGTFENLTAACGPCNTSKGRKPLLHFLLSRNASAQLAGADAGP